MESGKCGKYQRFYQRQRLAFAPMVTNSLGQYGPDSYNSCRTLRTIMQKQCLDFLWMKILLTVLSLQHPLPSKQPLVSMELLSI